MDPRTVPVRYSHLRRIDLSPLHYLHGLVPDDDSEQSAPMRAGKLVHALVLGGDYVVYDGRRAGGAWEEFAAAHEGRFIVTTAEYQRAVPVAESVQRDPVASQFLRGQHERMLDWRIGGRECQAHVDCIGPDNRYVTELKTASLAAPGWFARAALRMRYHAQLAWYQDAIAEVRGVRPANAYIVAVETKAPYAVTTMILTPRALDEGRKICRLWWERLAACEASDEWPGYAQSAVTLDVAEDVELVIDGEEVAA